jgi:enamine deaminase RidA (YjgF/YER057c/UK114 family)
MLILSLKIDFMLKKYFVYQPAIQGSIEDEWEQCRNQLVMDMPLGNRPLKLNIFVNLPDYQSYVNIRKIIGKSVIETFGEMCPAFNVSIHPPEKPFKLVVEGLFVSGCPGGITTKFYDQVPYVVIESDSFKEVWGAGLGDDKYMDDTRKAANAAFDAVVEILQRENLSMNHLVRQWNFIGNILEMREGFQNYQIFNEVRSEYYKKYRTGSGFPAATGVGMKYGGVFLDFCAVKSDDAVKIKAINNPNQINAYEYGQQVLKGLTPGGSSVKHPPQFERALLMINKTNSTLFVSGTASIIGQETIGRGDVSEQTVVTIENIMKLANAERINKFTGGSVSLPGRFSLLRVYIKKQEDFTAVKGICQEHFPGTPAIFIEADICRDDLLTEIEAEVII